MNHLTIFWTTYPTPSSMKKFVWVILLILPLAAQSQKPPIKFGEVSMDELKMVRYEKDTAAAAVILTDFGESTMIYTQGVGFTIRFERIKRIKILNKKGYEFANESISLYHTTKADEKLGSLKAVTYNLEGGKRVETKLKPDAIFKEKSSESLTLVKFTLPNVKEGSVIDITYEILSEFIYNFQDWEFQSTIPIQWSEYRTHIPQYYHYDQFMQGYLQVSINEQNVNRRSIPIVVSQGVSEIGRSSSAVENVDYQEYSSRWVVENAPAFKVEPFMNNYRDYFSKINFEIAYTEFPNKPREDYMGTWAVLNKEFLESASFGGAIKNAGFLDNITEEVIKGTDDPKEKIAKIYAYVKENIAWDEAYRKYTSDNLKTILNKKRGNSADINLILVSMLQRGGMNAAPVLISTRNHGFVREQFPQSAQFNYVIAAIRVEDKITFLDATDRTLPMNVLPEHCLNGKGYLIANDNPGWVSIIPNFKSRTVSSFDFAINDEGELSGKINISHDGYPAQEMRQRYHSKGEADYVSGLGSAHHWEVEKSAFDNLQKLNEPAKESLDIKVPEYAQKGEGTLYLNPVVMNQITENPFKTETRAYPVDFGSPSERLLMGKFVIPSGYVVEELPKVKVLGLPKNGGKYTYSISVTGNTIQFTSHLIINQALFTQQEYPNLKEFYNQVVAKQAEQIVLRKKQ